MLIQGLKKHELTQLHHDARAKTVHLQEENHDGGKWTTAHDRCKGNATKNKEFPQASASQ
jgi:hypothetical protein